MDVLFAISTALLFGVLAVSLRRGLGLLPDAETGATVSTVVAFAVLLVVAVPIALAGEGLGQGAWRYAIIGVLTPGLSQIVYLNAVKGAGPSRAGILVGMSPVIAAIVAIGARGEPFRVGLAVATVLIVLGGVALAREGRRPEHVTRLGLTLALCGAGIYAAQANLLRWAGEHSTTHSLVGAATMAAAGSVVVVAHSLLRDRAGAARRVRAGVRPFLVPGLSYGASYVTLNEAYAHGRVVVVSPLIATHALWTVLFSVAYLGRHAEGLGRRIALACPLVVAGGVLVGVFR